MRDRVLVGLALSVIILLVWVSALANTIARKDGEINLLKDKLSISQSVNDGLKDSVEKLIRYNECIAKIMIAPRSQTKAIAGDINDPATALERCRIEVGGEPISENPQPSPAPTSQNPPPSQPTSPQNTNGQGQAAPQPTVQPPPPNPPAPPESVLPFIDDPLIGCIGGVCI